MTPPLNALNAEIDQTKISVVNQVALGEYFPVEEDQEDIPVDQVVTTPATPMNGNVSMANALEASDKVMEKPIVSMAQTRCSAHEDRFQDPTLEKSTFSCRPEVFTCEVSRQCIPKKSLCDHFPDCAFQEDEKDCQIVQITVTCRMNEFECSPNVCIHESWVCDGRADCRDGADEAECHQCRPDTKFSASIGKASI